MTTDFSLALGRKQAVLIVRSGGKEQVHCAVNGEEGPLTSACTLVATVRSQTSGNCRLIVLGGSDRCYVVSVEPVASAQKGRRSLAFAVENELPVDAEDLIITEIGKTADRTCALAVEREHLAGVFDALAATGIKVTGWLPAPLSLIQEKASTFKQSNSSTIVLSHQDGFDVAELSRGVVCGWYSRLMNWSEVDDLVFPQLESAEAPAELRVYAYPDGVAKYPAPDAGDTVHEHLPYLEAAARLGIKYLQNPVHRGLLFKPEDLGQDNEVQGRSAWFQRIAGLVALLCLLLSVALQIRTLRLNQLLTDLESSKREQITRVLGPVQGTDLPDRRLAEGLAMMEARSVALAQFKDRSKILVFLRDVLLAIPDGDDAIQIRDISVSEDSLIINGEAGNLERLDVLVKEIENKGFQVRIEQYTKDFEVSIFPGEGT